MAELAQKCNQFNVKIPNNLGEIYIAGSKTLKLKDPSVLTEIRVSKENRQPNCDIPDSKNISTLLTNLSLLENKATVCFHDINRVNLKYSTNLAAILYKLDQGTYEMDQLIKLAK